MKKFLLAFLFALLPVTAVAQPPVHDLMPVVVEPTRILIGTEFVPRCLDLPTTLIADTGQVVTPGADSTFDCVEIRQGGTLKYSRTQNTVLRATHVIVLPGGVLDMGTQADCIPATVKAELVIRDVPIDVNRDPFQWGNGLLNFGKRTSCGASKLPHTTIGLGATSTADVQQGATTITLSAPPVGWQIGDELLIPDMAHYPYPNLPRRETRVTVAAVNGNIVTLSKGLDFAHLAVRDPDGFVVLLPYVANLTRNVAIRSENPSGTPGHTADVGHDATWDIRYTAFVGLGRTRAEAIDSATADATGTITHIGTNQIGRYAFHHHHAQGFGSKSIGNVLVGSNTLVGKWGEAIHGTHDAQVEWNIYADFKGAGVAIEDGYEMRNVIRKNFGAYNRGPQHLIGPNASKINFLANCAGCEGTAFWLHGTAQTFDENVGINNSFGVNLFNLGLVKRAFPSTPGGPLDTTLENPASVVPISMRANVMAVNQVAGVDYWDIPKFPNRDLIAVNNSNVAVLAMISEARAFLVNPTIICAGGRGTGILGIAGYVTFFDIEGGRIAGCETAMAGGLGTTLTVIGTTLQNVKNAVFNSPEMVVPTTKTFLFDNVLFLPLGAHPLHTIELGNGKVWDGVTPLTPTLPASSWTHQHGSRWVVKNHQRVPGNNFTLYQKQSLGSTACWPSGPGPHVYNSPEAGLTMLTCWTKYGIAFDGYAVPDAEAVPFEGLINGIARSAPEVFGPPAVTLTFPTTREAAIVFDDLANDGKPTVVAYGLLVGNAPDVSQDAFLSVDGGSPLVGGNTEELADTKRWRLKDAAATTGPHTVTTWRTDTAGQKIAASERTFGYFVGETPPPPVCVPPQILVNNVCVDLPPPPPPPPPAPEWTTVAPGFQVKRDGAGLIVGFRFCLAAECKELVIR